MKHRNFSFQIIALLIFSLFEPTFTKDQPASQRSQELFSSDDDFTGEYEFTPADLIRFQRIQEEALDEFKTQADNILYSLEQVEQILNANKINFDEKKITKKELLQEIKGVKAQIEQVYLHLSSLPTPDALGCYIFMNKGFLDYLLPCIKNDISLLNAESFALFASEIFNPESSWNAEYEKLSEEEVAYNNQKDCAELMIASEQVGLTSFNKAFRSFQDTPVISNYSAMSLVGYGAATIGVISLAAALVSYIQTTTPYRDLTIPVTDVTQQKQPEHKSSIELFQQIFGIKNNSTTPLSTIPSINIKQHTPKGYIELFQDFIGRRNDTATAQQGNNLSTDDAIQKARSAFGLFNYIHTAAIEWTDPKFISVAALFLYDKVQPICNHSKEKCLIAYKKSISYLRGEVDKTSNSMFESSTQKVYFKDMIGSEYLEERALQLADFIKHPQRYQSAGIIPTTGILLTGPPQTGKSFFAQALQTLINEENGINGQDVKFMYVTQELIWRHGLDRIFEYARENAPFILFIDEIDMLGARREKDGKTTNDLMTNMSGLSNDKNKQVIVIAATNRPKELDFALLEDGRFGDQIRFELPSYENRKKYLLKSLNNRNITVLAEDYIDSIAQETKDCTYNTLDKIIRCALMKAKKESRPVRHYDFEASLDSELRKIQPNTSMNAREKEIVAIYHAGQAAARHILSTDQQVVKVTIHAVDKPVIGKEGFEIQTKSNGNSSANINHIKDEPIRAIKLGNVFTLSTSNNKELLSDQEKLNELMALLAGQAALELIKGQCYNNFGKEDRAIILHELEQIISQGTGVTDAIRLQAIAEKDRLYAQVKAILQPHLNLVHDISNALIKNYTINRSEFIALTQNYIQ